MKSQCSTHPLTISLALLIGACLTFGLAAAQSSAGNTASAAEVKIDNFTFQSPTLTVPAGTEVTWTNRDDIPHTVVSDEKLFKSHALDTEDKFSFRFTRPGTYHYFCSLHPKMTAEVIVR